MSKKRVTLPNANLAGFPSTPDQSPPLAESITSCKRDKIAPVISSKNMVILRPLVDLRRKLSHACGAYLTTVSKVLTLPKR